MVRPTLTVTANTNLQDIQNFIQQNHGAGKKLFAKTDDNGVEVLYLKKYDGFSNTIKGKTTEKQDAARAILTRAVDNTLRSAGVTNNSQALEHLGNLADTISDLHFSQGGGDVRANTISQIVTHTQTFVARLASLPAAPAPTEDKSFDNPNVNLASLGASFATDPAMAAARSAIGGMSAKAGQDQIDVAAEALGTAIAGAYADPAQGHGAAERTAFALSTGETLKHELKQQFANIGNDTVTDKVITRAYEIAAATISDDKADSAATHKIEWKRSGSDQIFSSLQPEITVGGKRYEPQKMVKEGGFGDVYLYRQTDAKPGETPHELALKIPKNSSLKAQKEFLGELSLHSAAFGDKGSDFIMGNPGAVRMPDGGIALTMEFLPHGDVHEFSSKLADAIAQPGPDGKMPTGKISAQDAKLIALTLTADMARGLAHMKDMTHYDFKGSNCVIGSDGRAKIIDFGTVKADTVVHVNQHVKVDTPRFLAPERIYASEKLRQLGKVEDAARKDIGQNAAAIFTSELNKIGINIDDSETKKYINSVSNNITSVIMPKGFKKDSVTVDNKVDIWALGMTAHKLFTGVDFADEFKSDIDIEFLLTDWDQQNLPAIHSGTAIGQTPTTGELLSTTGHADADAFLNKILARDPAQRPDGATIANDPFLKQKGIDTIEARNLITALASGDAGKIDQARAALQTALM